MRLFFYSLFLFVWNFLCDFFFVRMKWNGTVCGWFNWIYNYTLMDHGTKFAVIFLLSVFNETYFRSPAALHAYAFLPIFLRELYQFLTIFFSFSFDWTTTFYLFVNVWKQISSKFLHSNSQNLLKIPIQKCMQEILSSISVNFSRLLRANDKDFFFSCVRVCVHMGGGDSRMCTCMCI